jgi:predicted oxidoreductase
LDVGIDLIDTADIYGPDNSEPFGAAEALLGRVLTAEPALRGRIVLASKGGISMGVPYDSSASYLGEAINASLRRLCTDTIDLWQVHRRDVLTHPQEVARAIEDAHRAGKIRAFGVSNHAPPEIAALQQFLSLPISSTQPELSPLAMASVWNGELDQAMSADMAVLAWSPLGGGRIAQPTNAREQAVADALDRVADAQGVSRTVAAFSWIMAHPSRPIPIIGSQRAERIAEAARAFDVIWTRSDWYAVAAASRGEPLP